MYVHIYIYIYIGAEWACRHTYIGVYRYIGIYTPIYTDICVEGAAWACRHQEKREACDSSFSYTPIYADIRRYTPIYTDICVVKRSYYDMRLLFDIFILIFYFPCLSFFFLQVRHPHVVETTYYDTRLLFALLIFLFSRFFFFFCTGAASACSRNDLL